MNQLLDFTRLIREVWPYVITRKFSRFDYLKHSNLMKPVVSWFGPFVLVYRNLHRIRSNTHGNYCSVLSILLHLHYNLFITWFVIKRFRI